MVRISSFAAAAVASFATLSAAHPGEHHDAAQVKRELMERTALADRSASSLIKCADTLKARQLASRAVARRAAKAEELRKKRGINMENKYLHRRDLATLQYYETVNHNMTSIVDPASNLFGSNTSCILTPENTIGPYYVSGELLRENVTEGEAGVPMHLEMQFIDTNTCEPVPQLLIDIWSCNATGVYSGIDASEGEGGLNSTYLRGLQRTSADGVAQFDTIVPGHYDGRATHEHVVAHVNASLLSNGSYSGGVVAHIGQIFFDPNLRAAVEATYPYNTNTIEALSNDDDMWAPTQADNNYDPFPEYVYLSEDITDGILAWISIGVDTTANRTANVSVAAYYAADGGHDSGTSFIGGGSGDNSTMPSGTGAPPSATSTGLAARAYNLKKLFGGAARMV